MNYTEIKDGQGNTTGYSINRDDGTALATTQSEAEAKLLSSAPELLEALKTVYLDLYPARKDAMSALISKAGG